MNAATARSVNLWLPAIICGLLLAFSPAQDTPPAAAQDNPPAAVPIPAPGTNQDQEQEFTIHSNVDRVLLDVSVKDARGGFVSGLEKADFRVLENGKPQEITEFTAGDVPVTVGILLDQSGSMRPKQTDVLTAALSFAKESNPSDEMFVVRFNEKAELMFGYHRTEMIGEMVEKLIPERLKRRHEHDRDMYNRFDVNQRARTMGIGLNLIGRHSDGHEFSSEITLARMVTPKGIYILASVRFSPRAAGNAGAIPPPPPPEPEPDIENSNDGQ